MSWMMPGKKQEPVSIIPTLDPGQEEMAALLRKMLAGTLSPSDYLAEMQSFLKGVGGGASGAMPTTPALNIPAMPTTPAFSMPSAPSISRPGDPPALGVPAMPGTPPISATTAGAGLLDAGGIGGALGSEATKALRDALSGKVSEEYFQSTVAGPAARTFREEIAPTLREEFVGPGTFWGGARGEAVGREGMRLSDALAAARGGMAQGALDRQLQAALGYGQFQAGAEGQRAQFMSQNYATWMNARSQDYSTWSQATGKSYGDWLDARSQDFNTWASATAQMYGAEVSGAVGGYSSWVQAKSQDYNTWAQMTGGAYSDWLDARSQDYSTWRQGKSQDLATYMQGFIQANPTYADTINSILQYLNIPTLAAYQNPEYMPGAIQEALKGVS